jgi:hypothetical protein
VNTLLQIGLAAFETRSGDRLKHAPKRGRCPTERYKRKALPPPSLNAVSDFHRIQLLRRFVALLFLDVIVF